MGEGQWIKQETANSGKRRHVDEENTINLNRKRLLGKHESQRNQKRQRLEKRDRGNE